MKKISIYLSAIMSLFFLSACGPKEYIIVPGPRLQTYEVNATKLPPLKIHYKVREWPSK